jgi:hypothetical protein
MGEPSDQEKQQDDRAERIRLMIERWRTCETCGRETCGREKNAHSRLKGWFCTSCESKR